MSHRTCRNGKLTVQFWTLTLSGVVYSGATLHAGPNTFSVYVQCPSTVFSPGHAWISVTPGAKYVCGGTEFSYGFYPKTWNIFGGAAKIKNDGARPWSWKITWTDISNERYLMIANFIRHAIANPGNYDLLGDNCVGFAKNVAGIAGKTPPNGINRVGLEDPYALCHQFAAIGNGGIFNGGTVTQGTGIVDWHGVVPKDYSYEAIADDTHSNTAAQTAAFMNLSPLDSDEGDFNLQSGGVFNINLNNANPSASLISINWGDGSLTEQSDIASHVYAAPGTYEGSVVVIDSGSVQRYGFTALVGAGSPSAQLSLNIPTAVPASGENVGYDDVPDPCTELIPEPGTAGVLTIAAAAMLRRRRES
jgi:hypothetical protein